MFGLIYFLYFLFIFYFTEFSFLDCSWLLLDLGIYCSSFSCSLREMVRFLILHVFSFLILCDLNPLKFIETWWWPRIWFILVNILCVLEKNVLLKNIFKSFFSCVSWVLFLPLFLFSSWFVRSNTVLVACRKDTSVALNHVTILPIQKIIYSFRNF